MQPTSIDFLRHTLDSLSAHIAVVDDQGVIQFANRTWTAFGNENGFPADSTWLGSNYLSACDTATARGDPWGLAAARGIRQVMEGITKDFYFEYPCHSETEERWFLLHSSGFEYEGRRFFVISHENITQRKLAEIEVARLADTDLITELPNRYAFEKFLDKEMLRCQRLKHPLVLAFIRIDNYSVIRDLQGVLVGDECLIEVGRVLSQSVRRPSDLAARFSDELFAVVFSNADTYGLVDIIKRIGTQVKEIRIPDQKGNAINFLSVCAGVVTVVPDGKINKNTLITAADNTLHLAKALGHDKAEFHTL